MFRKLAKVSIVAAITMFSQVASADLEAGINAANRGEFHIAIQEFEPLAEMGFADAQYQLAMLHYEGLGVPRNYQKAFDLLMKSADQNYTDAEFTLSVMFADGLGVNKDPNKSFEYTSRAANKGLAAAEYNLGVAYASGLGVIQDYRQAFKWYKRAAEKNYALAQYNLANLYYHGLGVKKSIEMSYIWNSIAAFSSYKQAEQSRDFDASKLTLAQVEKANEKVQEMYRLIRLKSDKANGL